MIRIRHGVCFQEGVSHAEVREDGVFAVCSDGSSQKIERPFEFILHGLVDGSFHLECDGESETLARFRALQTEALETFRAKNADYGNNFGKHGILGVMVRLSDKLDRLINLVRKDGERAVKEEAVRDTLLDTANYAPMPIIAYENGEEWEERTPRAEEPTA